MQPGPARNCGQDVVAVTVAAGARCGPRGGSPGKRCRTTSTGSGSPSSGERTAGSFPPGPGRRSWTPGRFDVFAEHAVTPQSLVSDGKENRAPPIGRTKNPRPTGCGLFAGPRSGGPPAAGPAMGPAGVLTRAFLDSGPGGPGTARSLPGGTRFFFALSKWFTLPGSRLNFDFAKFQISRRSRWFGIPGPGPAPYVPPVGSVGG